MLTELLAGETAPTALAVTVLLIVTAFILSNTSGRKLPPGPTGLPLVGYLPFLTSKPYVKLLELRKKYGPVYRLRFGSHSVVVLSNYPSMKEAYSQDALMGRPPDLPFELNKETIESGVLHNLPFKEQRRFSLHAMRDLGFGKSSMEIHIKEEIEELLGRFEKERGKPFVPSDFLMPSMSNNISSLVFGKRRKFDDPTRVMLDGLLKNTSMLVNEIAWLSFFPWLKKIFRFLNIGKQNEFLELERKMKAYIRKEIKEHQNSLDPNNVRDYVDRYLLEIEKNKHNPKSTFKVAVLEDMVRGLFGAGSETVLFTVDWLLYITAALPEVQKKVQQEIDEVIGRERFPSRSDHVQMPFTEAVILETLRWRAFFPINFPRYTLEDMKVNSYCIPKDTQVIGVIWAVHHDPELWGNDVGSFKPERFLSEDGKEIQKPEYFMPFSIGKRSCPGERLAYVEVFMYFVAILQKFRLRLPEGVEPDFEPMIGMALQAKPYQLYLEPRA